MAEYIDIDAQVVVTDTRGRERETTVRHILEMNKGVYTAADVRPVVLCRDCKWWETSWTPRGVGDGRHYCAPLDLYPSADWFCADGKKMEES